MSKSKQTRKEIARLTKLDKQIERIGNETVRVNTASGQQEMTLTDASIRQLLKSAIGGSPHSLRHFLDRMDRVADKRRAEIDRDIEFWTNQRAVLYREYEDHNRRCGCNPKGYPHPDDIEINQETGVRINGPLCDADVATIVENRKFVRAFLLQSALESRLSKETEEPKQELGSPLSLATLINVTMPERYRVGDMPFLKMMMDFDSMPKRELLKSTYKAWKELGVPIRRGQPLPPAERIARLVHSLFAFCKVLLEERPTGADLDQLIEQFVRREFG